MAKKEIKTCTECSFHLIDEDIENLSSEEQVEFEKFNTDSLYGLDKQALERLSYLLQKIRRKTCIGGLTKENEIMKNCKYYKDLSKSFDKNQLLNLFIANYSKRQTKINLILNIVLGIITVFVSFYGLIQNNQNTELKQKIEQDNIKMDELYTKIILLNDSINQLNTIKKNN